MIDRFSEDIDLSIERDFFGFGTPNNPENASSKKKQNLSEACTSYVQNELSRELTNAITAKLGTHKGWQLLADPDDPDSKTLLFEYQSKKSNADYLRHIVKIEIGARSEHWPVSNHIVHSRWDRCFR